MWHNYPVFVLSTGMKLTIAVLVIWTLIWKGLALWRAAKNNHTAWYVIMLIVNTVGILEIIYLLTAGKKPKASM